MVRQATFSPRDTGHSRPTEPVKYNIPRLGVVEDVPHDGLVRNFGVVGVGVVNRIVLSFAHVGGEGFAAVRLARIIGFSVVLDELGDERVWARGVVRRVRQRQDVFV